MIKSTVDSNSASTYSFVDTVFSLKGEKKGKVGIERGVLPRN